MRAWDIAERVFPLLAIIAFFILWEIACTVFQVPVFILPKPSEFLGDLIKRWPAMVSVASDVIVLLLHGIY